MQAAFHAVYAKYFTENAARVLQVAKLHKSGRVFLLVLAV